MSNIEHQPGKSRFVTTVDGHDAQVIYEIHGEVLHLTHTLVPSAIGGRGIAGLLVKATLDHARQNGLKVAPDCSYADVWIRRHPDYQDLVA